MANIHRLVRKAQKGDAGAFTELFGRYEADIYRMAYVYVHHEQDALDVVQETAYRSFKDLGGLKEPGYFKTWLIRIAINCSLDVLRKRKRIVPFTPLQDDAAEMDHNANAAGASATEEEAVAVSFSLQAVCDKLDEREKTIVLLRFYQDFTIRETAEILNIPLGTAKTLLYRALGKLRVMLREEDGNE